jgi:hypothetical protein
MHRSDAVKSMYMLTSEWRGSAENAELVRTFYSPKYMTLWQAVLITAISKDRLVNLINVGAIKAKQFDYRTLLIEWDSLESCIDSLPDVAVAFDLFTMTEAQARDTQE